MDTLLKQYLYETRSDLSLQMRRALACRTKKEKIKLAEEWQKNYSERMYRELISCARNKEVCVRISNWEQDGRIQPPTVLPLLPAAQD